MAYSNSLKVFWFNPMRSGTRSTQKIQEFLKFTDSGLHDEPTTKFKEFLFVSNFRNPYSRFVSIFHFQFPNEKRTIDNFKIFVEKKIWEEQYLTLKPDLQLSLTGIFEKRQMFPNYLVKLENLYDDIINLPFVKNYVNDEFLTLMDSCVKKNGYLQEYRERASWQEHYDEKTANLVYEFLEKDFILGNYEKDSWKNGTS